MDDDSVVTDSADPWAIDPLAMPETVEALAAWLTRRAEHDAQLVALGHNPYLALAGAYGFGDVCATITSTIIATETIASEQWEEMLRRLERGGRLHSIRNLLCARYAWAIPNEAALSALSALGPLVEIGAGTGYWAALLRAQGVNIRAYDVRPPRSIGSKNHYHAGGDTRDQGWGLWTDVRYGTTMSASAHGDRALLLCWPPFETKMASDALRAYPGDIVCYIGESAGGCTADDAFYARLEREWTEIATLHLPQWYGVHDNLHIFRRTRYGAHGRAIYGRVSQIITTGGDHAR